MAQAPTGGTAVATAADPKADAQPSHSALDWHILQTARCNVLVTGIPETVERMLAALMPYLDQPVWCWTLDTVLPPTGDVGTLIIRNVDALSVNQQRELSSWLEQSAVTRTWVVSTTTVPLFQRVAAGLFSEVLYYRLNTLLQDTQCQPCRNEVTAVTATIGDVRAVAHRAFELYLERGCLHGHDVDDWLQAEHDLRANFTTAAAVTVRGALPVNAPCGPSRSTAMNAPLKVPH